MTEEEEQKNKKEKYRLRRELRKQTFGYVVGALSLVAGLAWNEAIKAVIDFVFPLDRTGLWAKFIYAAVLTIVVILVSVYVGQLLNPTDDSRN